MNVNLARMISQPDRGKRARLASEVQHDIQNIVREYTELMNRHERILKALVEAGLSTIDILEDPEKPLELK